MTLKRCPCSGYIPGYSTLQRVVSYTNDRLLAAHKTATYRSPILLSGSLNCHRQANRNLLNCARRHAGCVTCVEDRVWQLAKATTHKRPIADKTTAIRRPVLTYTGDLFKSGLEHTMVYGSTHF